MRGGLRTLTTNISCPQNNWAVSYNGEGGMLLANDASTESL